MQETNHKMEMTIMMAANCPYVVLSHDDDTNSMLDYQRPQASSYRMETPLFASSFNTQGYDKACSSNDSDLISSTSNDESSTSKLSLTLDTSSLANYGNKAPKTFLQLRGMAVENYSMGCNFTITAAI